MVPEPIAKHCPLRGRIHKYKWNNAVKCLGCSARMWFAGTGVMEMCNIKVGGIHIWEGGGGGGGYFR